MKKILIAVLMFSVAGIAQAAPIDGEAPGTDKHEVIGFGTGDSLVAQSLASGTAVVLTDINTPVGANSSLDTTGLLSGFIHDYIFTAVQDSWITISSASELSTGGPGTIISPLVLEVWHILAGLGNDVLLGTDTVVQVNPVVRAATVTADFVAGESYVVRMSNEGGTIGTNPNYTLNVLSAVPVPAAVWLFGTALLGLFGFKRKSQAASKALAA